MAKTRNRSVAGSKSANRGAISGRFVSGSYSRSTRVKPISDVDIVGAVRLTTPQQVARLSKLKQRVDAELEHRGMRDSA